MGVLWLRPCCTEIKDDTGQLIFKDAPRSTRCISCLNELVNNVVGMCLTRAIQLKKIKAASVSSVVINHTQALEIQNRTVRALHALHQRHDRRARPG